jgi:GntR family transcriptional regulator
MSNYIHSDIEQVLTQRILSGFYAVGSKVPSENELKNEFYISRNTASRVLNELENRGLIVRYKGKGSFVAASKITQTLMAEDGDPRVTAVFLKNHKSSYSKLLSVSLVDDDVAVSDFLKSSSGKAIRVYRLSFASNVPQIINETYFDPDRFPFLLKSDLDDISLFTYIKKMTGLYPVREDMIIEMTYLGNSEAKMLCQESGATAFLQTSKEWAGEDIPFCFNRSIYRGDTMRFSCSCRYK